MDAISICELCGKEFTQQNKYYKKRFCSIKCANTHNSNIKKEERILKARKTLKEALGKKGYVWTEKRIEAVKKRREEEALKRRERLTKTPTERLKSRIDLKEKVLLEQKGKCLFCKREQIWLGKFLPFELDHIDGDKKNNSRENLRVLCPNCHSQTPTWRKPKKYLLPSSSDG